MARKYPPSIIQSDLSSCFFTGSWYMLERHHIFGGNGRNREHSTDYGCVIAVTSKLHNLTPYSIHENHAFNEALKKHAQAVLESNGMSRGEFRMIFGKSWLADGEDGYREDWSEFIPAQYKNFEEGA